MLVGKVDAGDLAFLYQHLNAQGEFVTGQCKKFTLEVLANGRYRYASPGGGQVTTLQTVL